MEDMISRKMAIEALQEHRNLFCDNTPETFSKLSYAEKSRVDELDMAIATLINLPPAQPETHEERTETHACDLISRQAAMEEISKQQTYKMFEGEDTLYLDANDVGSVLASLPSAQPTLYGYDIEHLKLIANVMQKENLPPERVTEALMDIGRIVAIVRDEFEETLRKAVEQCRI